jgi:hypothetical protein
MEVKKKNGVENVATLWGAEFENIPGGEFCRIRFNGKEVVEVNSDGLIYICADAGKVKLSPYFKGKIEGVGPKHV